MNNDGEKQLIEIELASDIAEKLLLRADSMGLTDSEYVECILGHHVAEELEEA